MKPITFQELNAIIAAVEMAARNEANHSTLTRSRDSLSPELEVAAQLLRALPLATLAEAAATLKP